MNKYTLISNAHLPENTINLIMNLGMLCRVASPDCLDYDLLMALGNTRERERDRACPQIREKF